jgi:squalene-associated FAD-dependent desaturase
MAQTLDRIALRPAVKHVHIIGAGLAGLSAAVALTQAGRRVTLYEAGPAAGGRCRSYFDRALDARIDNGNHLLLSGNEAAMQFLTTIGARETLTGPDHAMFGFMDLASGERWRVEPSMGRVPWWLLTRRVPGTRLADYLGLLRLKNAKPRQTVAECLGGTELYRKLLEPLAVSGLNTQAHAALASLMWAVVEGSLMRGGAACIPLVPREGLSESFIDPALAWLQQGGTTLHCSTRIARLDIGDGRVTALHTPALALPVRADEAVISAVPPWVAAELLPGLSAPATFEAIVNVHFRLDATPGFIGLIGGLAEWIFTKPGIVSVTISAANRLADVTPEEITATVWNDVKRALSLEGPIPPVRLLREKRATFAATFENEALRPISRTNVANLTIAGDWTATGLPATIEGAIRSGSNAAMALLAA